jgi:hypothetical protein
MLRTVLAAHNPLEEGPEGLYEACEQLLSGRVDEVLTKLRSAPDVATAAHVDGPNVLEAIRRALTRAGHNLEI